MIKCILINKYTDFDLFETKSYDKLRGGLRFGKAGIQGVKSD